MIGPSGAQNWTHFAVIDVPAYIEEMSTILRPKQGIYGDKLIYRHIMTYLTDIMGYVIYIHDL